MFVFSQLTTVFSGFNNLCTDCEVVRSGMWTDITCWVINSHKIQDTKSLIH